MKKKTFLFTAAILIGAITLHGQDNKEKQKVGGVRAGWHYAFLVEEGAKPDTASALSSFYAGFFRDTRIVPMLHFGSGIEYFQNGLEHPGNSARILHTVSIPLDLKVKLGPVFALGGIAANFKVSEKLKIEGEYVTLLDSDKTNWFDLPVFLGAGVKILFITVEARYHWGLVEARDGYYNRYFQLGAAISF